MQYNNILVILTSFINYKIEIFYNIWRGKGSQQRKGYSLKKTIHP